MRVAQITAGRTRGHLRFRTSISCTHLAGGFLIQHIHRRRVAHPTAARVRLPLLAPPWPWPRVARSVGIAPIGRGGSGGGASSASGDYGAPGGDDLAGYGGARGRRGRLGRRGKQQFRSRRGKSSSFDWEDLRNKSGWAAFAHRI